MYSYGDFMIFAGKSKRSKQNIADVDIRNQISQVCLNPNGLVEKLSNVLFKKIKHTSGHIHIHFRGKSDHLVIVWPNGMLREIVAKSQGCEKGQCVKWDKSQFTDYKREDVLGEFYNEVERMEINEGRFNKTWPSYQAFTDWLIKKLN